jgi:hypothetical protein
MDRRKVYKEKGGVWGEVFFLSRRPFRPCRNLAFEGTIYTDGVGLSVALQSQPTRAGQARKRKVESNNEEEDDAVEHLQPEEIKRLQNRMVYVDPNRRDLLYCMGHGSEARAKNIYRYTSQNRLHDLGSKAMNKSRRSRLPNEIRQAERELSLAGPSSTTNIPRFQSYLQTLSASHHTLRDHYTQKCYRRWKMQSYINNQRADHNLITNLRTNYGNDAVFILGDYSNPNVRFHAPARGIGFVRLLKKNGFRVYRINEFRTSRFCPCSDQAQPFLTVDNPRPFQRQKRPRVLCHGLLRCCSCKKLWNRDLLATHNFRTIVSNIAQGQGRPDRFQRGT